MKLVYSNGKEITDNTHTWGTPWSCSKELDNLAPIYIVNFVSLRNSHRKILACIIIHLTLDDKGLTFAVLWLRTRNYCEVKF